MCVSCDSQVYQAAAATGVNSGYNALVELFEAIENFLKHFDIYSKTPPTPAMDEVGLKIMLELLATLSRVTKDLKQGRPGESVLSDVLLYLVQRSESCKGAPWREGRRGSPTEARSTHPGRGSGGRIADSGGHLRSRPESQNCHGR